MDSFHFVEQLHAECGVRHPEQNEQDWEWCAGEPERTGDYLAFYQKYAGAMDEIERHLLVEMIVQGIEDLMCAPESDADIEALWAETREILLRDRHGETVEYWSCIGHDLENSWHITAKMRALLPCYYAAYLKPEQQNGVTNPIIAQIQKRYGVLCQLCPPLKERDCADAEKNLPAELAAVLKISNGVLELTMQSDMYGGKPFVSGVILYSYEAMLAETEDFAEMYHEEGTAFAGDGAGGCFVRKPDGTVWLYAYPCEKGEFAAESVTAYYAGTLAEK